MKILKIGLTVLVASAFLALTGCSTEPTPVTPVAAPVAPAPVKHVKKHTYKNKLGKHSTKKDIKK